MKLNYKTVSQVLENKIVYMYIDLIGVAFFVWHIYFLGLKKIYNEKPLQTWLFIWAKVFFFPLQECCWELSWLPGEIMFNVFQSEGDVRTPILGMESVCVAAAWLTLCSRHWGYWWEKWRIRGWLIIISFSQIYLTFWTFFKLGFYLSKIILNDLPIKFLFLMLLYLG